MTRIANIAALILLTIFISFPVISCAGNDASEKEAEKSAMNWLALVDSGKYGESWDDAASLFKQAITKEGWITTIKGARSPLGEVKSRKLESASYATTLPGAPDGEYVVIQYKTSFANKADAVETITPMKEADGSWKVSGYYIK